MRYGEAMPIKLLRSDTVVAGRFNPHIISPPWLVKEGIIKGEGVKPGPIEINVAGSGPLMVLQFSTGDFQWRVDDTRLVISAEGDSDATPFVSQIVNKLPHTPLLALGHNFHYICERPEWPGRLPGLGDLAVGELRSYGNPENVKWHVSFKPAADLGLNADITESAEFVAVDFNFHRASPGPEAVIAAAKRFLEDLSKTKELLQSLFRTGNSA
jgi:hypothetical protein